MILNLTSASNDKAIKVGDAFWVDYSGNAYLSGTIEATSGYIGNWLISEDGNLSDPDDPNSYITVQANPTGYYGANIVINGKKIYIGSYSSSGSGGLDGYLLLEDGKVRVSFNYLLDGNNDESLGDILTNLDLSISNLDSRITKLESGGTKQ